MISTLTVTALCFMTYRSHDPILRDFCLYYIYVGYANKVVLYVISVSGADEVKVNWGDVLENIMCPLIRVPCEII